jgi:hypothetical protein
MQTQTNYVSAEVLLMWQKVLLSCNNPLGLTEEMVEKSLETAPPKKYPGATFLGRHIIPRQYVRYDESEQPRDKNNESEHVNNLTNNFNTVGYRMDAQPPIVCFDSQSTSIFALKAQAGFNRDGALNNLGQECYIFDIYDYEDDYAEVVARNMSNHHSNPQLDQKIPDYVKEVVNAKERGLIDNTQSAIDSFVDIIAADRTPQQRGKIKKSSYSRCEVFSNFRTYNSTGHGKNTLNGFISSNGLAKQGIENRTAKDIKKQGYIVYCSGKGNNKSVWMRSITNSVKYGVPVYVIGYSQERVDDLDTFREKFIEDWNDQKEILVKFAESLFEDCGEFDESRIQVKLAGFMAQYIKPDPNDKGRPTEQNMVDMYGKTIKFDKNADCLTLIQP